MENQWPLTPFCCASAIPSSFRYIAELLPPSTSHNPLAKPLTSTPLVAVFLAYITSCYNHAHEPRPKEIPWSSPSPLYYAIVQLTTIKTTIPQASPPPTSTPCLLPQPAPTPSLHHISSPTSSPFTSAPDDERFSDISLTCTPPPSLSLPPDKTARYFVPLENRRETTILHPGQRIRGKTWKEIGERDAMESLRLCGSGDGERWRELRGVERMRCRSHGVEFEIRVWVKEL